MGSGGLRRRVRPLVAAGALAFVVAIVLAFTGPARIGAVVVFVAGRRLVGRAVRRHLVARAVSVFHECSPGRLLWWLFQVTQPGTRAQQAEHSFRVGEVRRITPPARASLRPYASRRSSCSFLAFMRSP